MTNFRLPLHDSIILNFICELDIIHHLHFTNKIPTRFSIKILIHYLYIALVRCRVQLNLCINYQSGSKLYKYHICTAHVDSPHIKLLHRWTQRSNLIT